MSIEDGRYKLSHRLSSSRMSPSSSSFAAGNRSSRVFAVPRPAPPGRERLSRKWATHLNTLWQSRLAPEVWDSASAKRKERTERGGRRIGGRAGRQEEKRRQAGTKTGEGGEGGEGLRRSLSVTGQSFFGVRTVHLHTRLSLPISDRSKLRARAAKRRSSSRMISLRATRPGSLLPPHCGRDFCPVCR